mgnify:FL=1|tara:strand:- start:3030 stop:3803 length:774 start_codon:yes stop_codon:yes gene_type:complete
MKTVLFLLLSIPFSMIAQFIDDFSDGDFLLSPTWFGDVSSFEVDQDYILHLNDSVASTSSLFTNSNALMNGEWIFDVRLEFSPSTNNYAKVYLVTNSTDLLNTEGVYVKIGGQSGNVDDLSLYVQTGTNHTQIIDGTDGLLTNNPDIKVKVTRDDVGNWELFLDTNGIFFSEGTAFDNSIIQSDYFGIYCKYTITRSNKFWFDNFLVNGTALSLLEHKKNKSILKIIDITSRESRLKNQPLFYIYDDGTVEKKIIID